MEKELIEKRRQAAVQQADSSQKRDLRDEQGASGVRATGAAGERQLRGQEPERSEEETQGGEQTLARHKELAARGRKAGSAMGEVSLEFGFEAWGSGWMRRIRGMCWM